VLDAPIVASQASLVGSTGNASTRVFQIESAGKRAHVEPGTGASGRTGIAQAGAARLIQAARADGRASTRATAKGFTLETSATARRA
jgi:hypothetical protein